MRAKAIEPPARPRPSRAGAEPRGRPRTTRPSPRPRRSRRPRASGASAGADQAPLTAQLRRARVTPAAACGRRIRAPEGPPPADDQTSSSRRPLGEQAALLERVHARGHERARAGRAGARRRRRRARRRAGARASGRSQTRRVHEQDEAAGAQVRAAPRRRCGRGSARPVEPGVPRPLRARAAGSSSDWPGRRAGWRRSRRTGARRPRRRGRPAAPRMRVSFSRALSRAVETARRETSTAVTSRAPRIAAAIASSPLPVHRSSTEARGGSVCSRSCSASSHVSLVGLEYAGQRSDRWPARSAGECPAPTASRKRRRRACAPRSTRRPRSTVGVEEELMLLDPATLDLAPRARGARAARRRPRASSSSCPPRSSRSCCRRAPTRRGGRGSSPPAAATCRPAPATVRGSPARACTRSRPRRASSTAGRATTARRPSTARIAPPPARLRACRSTSRSAAPIARWRSTTRCARYLPELAALAANAPFYAGRDTGLASMRPVVCRAAAAPGRPAARCDSWEALRRRAGAGSGDPGARGGGSCARTRLRHARAARARRAGDRGGRGGVAARRARARGVPRRAPRRRRAAAGARHWRIEENRWRACRHGVGGRARDLETGEPTPDRAAPARAARRARAGRRAPGRAGELAHARRLVERNGAMALREASAATRRRRPGGSWNASPHDRRGTGRAGGRRAPRRRRHRPRRAAHRLRHDGGGAAARRPRSRPHSPSA